MVEVERRLCLLAVERVGVGLDPLVALLQHDADLGRHLLGGERQVAHPVGFQFHHRRQQVGRDALIIGGVVARGEGILLPAIGLDDVREFAVRMAGRALEHQVLQKMRHARDARRLVGAADLVPDHMDHSGRAVILDHHHVHAVLKREFGDPLGRGPGHGRQGKGDG